MTTQPATGPTSAKSTRTITVVWLVLTAITVSSWWLAPGHLSNVATASIPITVAAIVLGLIKSRLIIRYFMEVHFAPTWLRRTTDAWLALLWGSVLIIYLL
jgi:hypothetical protein